MKDAISMTPVEGSSPLKDSLTPAQAINNAPSDESSGFTEVFSAYLTSTPENADGELTAMYMALPQIDGETGNELPADGQNQPPGWSVFMQMPLSEYTAVMNNPLQAGKLNDNEQGLQQLMATDGALSAYRNPMQAVLTNKPLPADNYSQLLADESLLVSRDGDYTQQLTSTQIKNMLSQISPDSVKPLNQDLLAAVDSDSLPPIISGTPQSGFSSLHTVNTALPTQVASTQAHAVLNFNQPAWESNLGSRMQWMIGNNIQHAELRLDPPDLGSLEVSVKVNHDQASVSFVSPHAHVREALEAAVPRLKEMLEQNGISLADVNVQQEAFSQQQQNMAERQPENSTGFPVQGELNAPEIERPKVVVKNGLVDAYA